MADKILFVDDEVAILESFKVTFRKRPYEVHTAVGPYEGLKAIQGPEPFAVVVSDFKMPEMDGITFLEQVQELSKDTVRIMLTGHADMDTAIDAVNKGRIFRFLTKPCAEGDLSQALEAGLEQYQLLQAERELLHGTLRGSIKIMGEVIQLLKPEVATRIHRIAPLVSKIAQRLEAPRAWEIDIATELCLLGLIFLPDPIINRINRGKLLTTEEFMTFRTRQELAQDLLSNIPRLAGVTTILKYQSKNYDGSGIPEDNVKGGDIPLGARILRVMLDFDWQLQAAKGDVKAAVRAMGPLGGKLYDPAVLAALDTVLAQESHRASMPMSLTSLKDGMVLAADIHAMLGNKRVKVLREGNSLTARSIAYLHSISAKVSLSQISVYIS